MAKYPVINAGQRMNAEMLRSMLPEYVRKTSDTDRASTTTLADDPDLTVELEASAVYFVEFILLLGGVAAADIKTAWTTPSGSSGFKAVIGPASNAATNSAADSATMRVGVHGFATPVEYSALRDGTGLLFGVQERGEVTTTSAGTLALQWAQVTSNATASRVSDGSLLRVARIG